MKNDRKPGASLLGAALLIIIACPLSGQTRFNFPIIHSPAGCTYTYDIDITITLDSVKLTNIYFDDGTTGSFAYRAYFSYANVFSNSTLPPGSFYTFDLTVYSDNPQLNAPTLTNNLGTVPLQTAAAGGYSTLNNPTYNASASALGLTLGGSYNDPTLLNTLGYDSAVLRINLPCLDTTMSADNDATLPVLWSRLQATLQENRVQLSWQTFAEQHNTGFRIERSVDGNNWVYAAFVPTLALDGNSSNTIHYNHSETLHLYHKYYYRLVQLDKDGQQNVSNIVTVQAARYVDPDNVRVYPNPATTQFSIIGIRPNAPFLLYDNHGRLLIRGNYQTPVAIGHLSPGVYLISVQDKRVRLIIK